jgi:hypothetical protein
MATKKPKKKQPARAPARSARTPHRVAAPSPKDRIASLEAVFHALGAREPHAWARAHAKEGSDALARFVLLRALWLKVLEPGRMLARAQQDAHAGPAMAAMLRKVDLADLDALVRLTQEHALRDVLSVLDDPGDDDQAVSWAVYRRDKKGAPAARLTRLLDELDAARP